MADAIIGIDMTVEQYHSLYGYERNQPGWEYLTDDEKQMIKNRYPFYIDPSGEEQRLQEEGPDTNIWRGLSEMLGIPAGAIKKHMMGLMGRLSQRPDFGEEYGLKAQELERSLSGQFASRGLLDSSAMATALGTGTSNLMMERATMEENAWMNRLGRLGQFGQQGGQMANFLNMQFMQEMGLLTGERERQMGFELQRYGIDPNLNDPMTTMEGALAIADVGASFFGGGFGGGGDTGRGGGTTGITGGYGAGGPTYTPPDYSDMWDEVWTDQSFGVGF